MVDQIAVHLSVFAPNVEALYTADSLDQMFKEKPVDKQTQAWSEITTKECKFIHKDESCKQVSKADQKVHFFGVTPNATQNAVGATDAFQ